MLTRLLKGLLTAAAFWFINRYRRLSIDLVKLEAAAYYLKAIQAGRRGLLAALLLWLAIFIFALGVALLHAGFFLWLYTRTESLFRVAIALLGLGGLYVVSILLIAGGLLSEAAWMKFFRADKLVAELTKGK